MPKCRVWNLKLRHDSGESKNKRTIHPANGERPLRRYIAGRQNVQVHVVVGCRVYLVDLFLLEHGLGDTGVWWSQAVSCNIWRNLSVSSKPSIFQGHYLTTGHSGATGAVAFFRRQCHLPEDGLPFRTTQRTLWLGQRVALQPFWFHPQLWQLAEAALHRKALRREKWCGVSCQQERWWWDDWLMLNFIPVKLGVLFWEISWKASRWFIAHTCIHT